MYLIWASFSFIKSIEKERRRAWFKFQIRLYCSFKFQVRLYSHSNSKSDWTAHSHFQSDCTAYLNSNWECIIQIVFCLCFQFQVHLAKKCIPSLSQPIGLIRILSWNTLLIQIPSQTVLQILILRQTVPLIRILSQRLHHSNHILLVFSVPSSRGGETRSSWKIRGVERNRKLRRSKSFHAWTSSSSPRRQQQQQQQCSSRCSCRNASNSKKSR